MDNIIDIRNLRLLRSDGQELVHGISFHVQPQEILGLVGESGSGKTLTLKSIIDLLPDGITAQYEEKAVRGRCGMIFQNPMSSLDPLCPVFRQLTEVVHYRQHTDRKTSAEVAARLFGRLSLPADLQHHDRYPSQLSGGQCQRLLIAMALACQPDILLCDEPTTALDVTIQKQTIDLIRDLQKKDGFAVVFVTHNLAVAASLCSRLIVMKDGALVEEGPTQQIMHQPQNAYTQMLLQAVLPVPRAAEDAPGKESEP